MLKVALVNAATGQVDTVEELPTYLKAILLSQPLHFGNYGGMPLKILWSLCTLLSLFITLNGAWLWWAKRQQKSLKGANNATVE
ncbi:PepSY domain-containing protein [Acinetobacter vivianii]